VRSTGFLDGNFHTHTDTHGATHVVVRFVYVAQRI